MTTVIFKPPLDTKIKKTAIAKKKWWRDIYKIILRAIQKSPRFLGEIYDISIVLISEEKMKELTTRYKGRDRVTDVLSFFYGKAEGESRAEGEMFICLPQAMRQARRYGVSLTHEIARLAVHGLLHIYGYDHQKKKERAVMRSLERVILHICKKENFL